MLIDSHCHIDSFSVDEQYEIVDNAVKNGVGYMLNACASRASYPKIIDVVSRFPNVYGAIGQHPEEAEREGATTAEELQSYITKNKKIIAIGETGLDYSGEHYNRELQIQNLLTHISVAQKTGLPLIIHNRNSNDDMCDILSSQMKIAKFNAIIHCFTGTYNMAQCMLSLGFYISASGIVTFKNASDLRDVFRSIPLSNLLVETDSPYLTPVPYRGKTNQPAFVTKTASLLAELKGVSEKEIADITTANFNKLFGLNLK